MEVKHSKIEFFEIKAIRKNVNCQIQKDRSLLWSKALTMAFSCREKSCGRSFSTKSSRNKHERLKGHQFETKTDIKFNENLSVFECPTRGCSTTSKYKYNIEKHLKSCYCIRKQRKQAEKNKLCSVCGMRFNKKSNRDRHFRNFHDFHSESMDFSNQLPTMIPEFNNNEENQEHPLPTSSDISDTELGENEEGVESIDFTEPTFESVSELTTDNSSEPTADNISELTANDVNDNTTDDVSPTNDDVIEPTIEDCIDDQVVPDTQPSDDINKKSRLESFISKLAKNIDHSSILNECVIEKLKRDLKDHQAEAVRYIQACFGKKLDDDSYFSWLCAAIDIKPNRLRNLLKDKTNRRNSKLPPTIYQETYDFWVENSITSTDSTNNIKRFPKDAFVEKYTGIHDPSLREEVVTMKKTGRKKLRLCGTKMIYVESIRKLCVRFNKDHTPVSITTFFKNKPFYCVVPTEKEKQSCVCINCQNPHLLLKAVNRYRATRKMEVHKSLTTYIGQLKNEEQFSELVEDRIVMYHSYERVDETYTKRDGTPGTYTRVTRVDHHLPLKEIVQKILTVADAYLKHRTYVDNISSTLPKLKGVYEGRYIELDYSQNLALRPKDEVQTAHYSGKQFTLHCAIVDPTEKRYHYHLSDDTNHDAVFVDHVLRDLIKKYEIKNEDLWIQSDNAPTQYKNKYAFYLIQQLSNEFNLRIIRTYGASGHGKGVIDGMSSFGVKNILRKDIVTHDVFFNKSEHVTDYLSIKCPHYSYTHIPSEEVVKSRIKNDGASLKIEPCMINHMIVFKPHSAYLCKEYLCSCSMCLDLKFDECANNGSSTATDDDIGFYNDDDDDGVDRSEQVFDFIEVPSYVSLFTGNRNEPLYFVQINEKGIADTDLTDPYGHFIASGEKFLRGFYLKMTRSRNINKKKFTVLPTPIYLAPDEICDTYVDITSDLYLDINTYNVLIQKANSYMSFIYIFFPDLICQ